MDFYKIRDHQNRKTGERVIEPMFVVSEAKDLMVRGKAFYAIWNEKDGLWSTNEYDVAKLVDQELFEYAKRYDGLDIPICIRTMTNFSSNMWSNYQQYLKQIGNSFHQLNTKICFQGIKSVREDYVSKRLSYSLSDAPCPAYEELVSTLYNPYERQKIEWAIGSIFCGDSVNLQKFLVFYGDPGSGKSTILNIVEKLFDGYFTIFEANELASKSANFSTAVFRNNPLIAIQHDGDLSRIEDNTKFNSIVSHEKILIHEKYKTDYSMRLNCLLFMATNKPVKITDAKSGIIRRLIDVNPSGRRLSKNRYLDLMKQVNFELGAIANHCMKVYQKYGFNFYDSYIPFNMIRKTDVFYNYVLDRYEEFSKNDGCTLKRAYALYKQYCDDTLVDWKLPMYKFREELLNYFENFKEEGAVIDGKRVRSYYSGFRKEKIFERISDEDIPEEPYTLSLEYDTSIFDDVCSECYAQYGNENETPQRKWAKVSTKLKNLDTKQLHYVRVPENHIVIDFDLKDEEGNKSKERNLESASKWPMTYAEYSKGGAGVHLHYIYDGDPSKLKSNYADGIEVKVFRGESALRRRLSKCNNVPIAIISSGLPLKGEKMLNFKSVQSEKGLREMILRNFRKEFHPGTKPSIDFIYKILEDAYNSGMHYDVTDMRQAVLTFANKSTHQSEYCVKLVGKMKFQSDDISKAITDYKDDTLVFYDVEVFPNLFLINWKYEGTKDCVRMINPTPDEVEKLFSMRLVGFNCRRYDNHILYARYLGYDNERIYKLSQQIINGGKNCLFGEAYNISYTDVYDFASAGNKKSLKKFEIELGIHHQELGFPWDQPVPEEKWPLVAEYCDNDVIATEAVFHHLEGDWAARQMLAELSGLTVNDTTNAHTTRIIFGDNKHPSLVYTDLRTGEVV